MPLSTLNKQAHDFSRIPQIRRPRSVFPMGNTRMQTMDASYLVPICFKEVLPGDTWKMDLTAFGRLATQLVPNFDNLYLKTYFFFDPYRLTWENFTKQHGERKNPNDSIDYTTPMIEAPEGGFAIGSIYDYMGCPTGVGGIKVSALPFRSINRIINQYFRDEQRQNSLTENTGDSDDLYTDYALWRKAKPHDYFTSSLLQIEAGGEPVSLPLGTTAPVSGNGITLGLTNGTTNGGLVGYVGNGVNATCANTFYYGQNLGENGTGTVALGGLGVTKDPEKSGLIADLSNATAATIASLRQAIALQELLEADQRTGTRYTEILAQRYNTINQDLTLGRAQYLGGTSQMISINPVVQTSGEGITGQTTPMGTLSAYGVVGDAGHVIEQSFAEFGCIIGFACITSVPSYYQGLPRKFTRENRFDYYYPEFANLTDQAILNQEIYAQAPTVVDSDGNEVNKKAFGYIPRYDEYRFENNEICGKLRGTDATSLQVYTFAEKFETLPQNGDTFIQDKTNEVLVDRVAVTDEPQFICKFDFNAIVYRGMPLYAVPKISSLL